MDWGAFIMAPWTGEIGPDPEAQLVPGAPAVASAASGSDPGGDPRHHGVARRSAFRAAGADTWVANLGAPLPVAGSVRQRISRFGDNRVVIRHQMWAPQPMRAALGWHPWLRRTIGNSDEVRVLLGPGTRRLVPAGRGHPAGYTLRMRWSTPHCILYTVEDAGVCVSPVTHPPSDGELLGSGEMLTLRIELRWFDERRQRASRVPRSQGTWSSTFSPIW